MHKIKAEITFQAGCKEVIEKTILPGTVNCDLNITYQRTASRENNPHNLNTVEVIYFDENGKAYSSLYANSTGEFTIESVNNYVEGADDNEALEMHPSKYCL